MWSIYSGEMWSVYPAFVVIWIIGVTDTPETRKSHHESDGKNIKYWSQWETDSEKVGRDVEKHFVDLGMDGDAGGGGQAEYVYVF
jgi:hypothetical protein